MEANPVFMAYALLGMIVGLLAARHCEKKAILSGRGRYRRVSLCCRRVENRITVQPRMSLKLLIDMNLSPDWWRFQRHGWPAFIGRKWATLALRISDYGMGAG
jgi:hypothetical protein